LDEARAKVKIRARIENSFGEHRTALTTNDNSHSIAIPPRESGFGSSANGGELLFLALATCYCNDIYREAAKRGIEVERVEVDVEGQFGAAGEPATGVTYRAKVVAHGTEAEIRDLMRQTDTFAEIQNTLRVQTPVTLDQIEAVAVTT
jgi:organic hydroperoxide reductase OsmC/OhrA